MVLRKGPRWINAVRMFMFCCVAASTAIAAESATLVSAAPLRMGVSFMPQIGQLPG